ATPPRVERRGVVDTAGRCPRHRDRVPRDPVPFADHAVTRAEVDEAVAPRVERTCGEPVAPAAELLPLLRAQRAARGRDGEQRQRNGADDPRRTLTPAAHARRDANAVPHAPLQGGPHRRALALCAVALRLHETAHPLHTAQRAPTIAAEESTCRIESRSPRS